LAESHRQKEEQLKDLSKRLQEKVLSLLVSSLSISLSDSPQRSSEKKWSEEIARREAATVELAARLGAELREKVSGAVLCWVEDPLLTNDQDRRLKEGELLVETLQEENLRFQSEMVSPAVPLRPFPHFPSLSSLLSAAIFRRS
jgi:hypothetical protein